MATRRPLVYLSGVSSELPLGDDIDGALYQSQQIVAGSGLVGGGFFGDNPRLDVALVSNPSGLYFASNNKLGIDGKAQASGNAALVSAGVALSSGNAALALGTTALASGNAALTVGTASLPLTGGTMQGRIVASGGTPAQPGLTFGDGGVYGSGQYFVGVAVSGAAVLSVTPDYVRVETNNFQIKTAKTPVSSTDTGTPGQIAWDSNYLYVCVATNQWKRSDLNTFP